jgi:CMP/dCMP kinase
MIIAIDGPAASGKGTLAKRLATHYGLRHLDTGLIYRAVAQAMLAGAHRLDDAEQAVRVAKTLDPTTFNEAELKRHALSEAASVISAIPKVRATLLTLQREFGRTAPGAVLDGRDIGTVVFPEADAKIFVTASPEIRARRRAAELDQTGEPLSYAAVLADIHRRDARDAGRAAAPLKPAPDAHLLDTTHLDIDAAFRAALDIVEAVRAGRDRG